MLAASWIDKSEYPFESKWFEIGSKRLHYVDEGQGKPIVFVHGCPTWSFLYRHLIKGLRAQYRCIALDNLGYGLSDKPTTWSYQPERHAEYFEDFIRHLQVKDFTLVVHGVGGPIGLSYALNNPTNISHIVAMNTFMWSLRGHPEAERINKLANGPLARFYYQTANIPVRNLRRALNNRNFFSRKAQEHYLSAMDEPETRVATLATARSLIGSSEFYQRLWERREAIAHIPAMLVWGMRDKLFGPEALSKFLLLWPDAEVKRLPETGHFVPEEKGPGLGPFLEMFIDDTAYLPTQTMLL
jgi:haloalkane dehalogenase